MNTWREPDLILLALKRAIEDQFSISDWEELGLLTGTTEHLNRHPRLFRSLRFGDDYGGCIADVLPDVLGPNREHLDDVTDLVDLSEWLRDNDPKLHSRIYGPELRLEPEDLSALRDPTAIEAHLRRLQSSVVTDPEHAIGVAKELVESTVKLVLQQLEVDFEETADLPQLAKQAQRELGLHPGMLSPNTRGLDASRKVLSGAHSNRHRTGRASQSVRNWSRSRHSHLRYQAAPWADGS